MAGDSDRQVNAEIMADLTPRNLIFAYAQGVFPMVEDGELFWFSPDPRGLMPLDERFHVSGSLQRTIDRGKYACTINHSFDDVVHLCSRVDAGGPTWISAEIREAYNHLHDLGLAHSVEAWHAGHIGEGQPVGGLYGVAVGAAFFAESMFHTATDAGKVALVGLVRRLRMLDYYFCDIQWTTDNLKRFGAFDLPRDAYLDMLQDALREQRSFC